MFLLVRRHSPTPGSRQVPSFDPVRHPQQHSALCRASVKIAGIVIVEEVASACIHRPALRHPVAECADHVLNTDGTVKNLAVSRRSGQRRIWDAILMSGGSNSICECHFRSAARSLARIVHATTISFG
jgi:hypothetical protein